MVTRFMGVASKLYYRSAGSYASPTWTEIRACKDVNVGFTIEGADDTARDASGWESVMAGHRKFSIETEVIHDPADAAWEALRAAAAAGTVLDVMALNGAYDSAGKKGDRADVVVTDFSRGQPLKGVRVDKVKMEASCADHLPGFVTMPLA